MLHYLCHSTQDLPIYDHLRTLVGAAHHLLGAFALVREKNTNLLKDDADLSACSINI
jgi:hypothetical protein